MDGWKNGWMEKCIDDGLIKRLANGLMDLRKDGSIGVCMDDHVIILMV